MVGCRLRDPKIPTSFFVLPGTPICGFVSGDVPAIPPGKARQESEDFELFCERQADFYPTLVFQIPCEDRCLNPQTPPEVFRGSKHLLTRYLEEFGCLGL